MKAARYDGFVSVLAEKVIPWGLATSLHTASHWVYYFVPLRKKSQSAGGSLDSCMLVCKDARHTSCNILHSTTSKKGYVIRTGRFEKTP